MKNWWKEKKKTQNTVGIEPGSADTTWKSENKGILWKLNL